MLTSEVSNSLKKLYSDWEQTIDDDDFRTMLRHTFVAGDCIASMLLNETVEEYDVYFQNKEAAKSALDYYLGRMCPKGSLQYVIEKDSLRIIQDEKDIGQKIRFPTYYKVTTDQDYFFPYYYNHAHPMLVTPYEVCLFNNVKMHFNLIGEPHIVVQTFDFTHRSSFWTPGSRNVWFYNNAERAILGKELVFNEKKNETLFSLYRLVRRGWTIDEDAMVRLVKQVVLNKGE